MEAMGVFSSWVTALRKLSWRSFRRISRTMKMVLTTRPAMMHAEENNAEDQRNDLPPVIDNPADIEYDGQGNETSAERDEKGDGFAAAGDAHVVLVYARAGDCHIKWAVKGTRSPRSPRTNPGQIGQERINRRWISPREKPPGQLPD